MVGHGEEPVSPDVGIEDPRDSAGDDAQTVDPIGVLRAGGPPVPNGGGGETSQGVLVGVGPSERRAAHRSDTVVTHSLITAFRECPKKAWFSYFAGGTGVVPSRLSKALAIGSSYHHAMELVCNSRRAGQDVTASDIRNAVNEWVTENRMDLPREDIPIIQAQASGAAIAHARKLNGLSWKIHFVEVIFKVQLLPHVVLTGKIDAVISDEDGTWIVEHKTASDSDLGDYLETLPSDAQVLRYIYSVRALGWSITGCKYTIAQKSLIRGRKNEPTWDTARRIEAELIEPGQEGAFHQDVRPGVDDVRRCISDTQDTARDIENCVLGDRPWTRHERSCRGTYGVCPFYRICIKVPWDGLGDVPIGFRAKMSRHEELMEGANLPVAPNGQNNMRSVRPVESRV